MSEEEKIEMIYTVYGCGDVYNRARKNMKKIAEEMNVKVVRDILNSDIGAKLLQELRRIVREEIEKNIGGEGGAGRV